MKYVEPLILLMVWGTILLILLNHISETTKLFDSTNTNLIKGLPSSLASFADSGQTG